MTFLSRVLGFVRDMVIARFFGATAMTDAFFVALRIPNLMRRLFAEGSFSLAFVPVLGEYQESHNRARLKELVNATAGALGAMLFLVVGIGMLASDWFVTIFAPGFRDNPDQFALASSMLRITFPYAMLISLVAFCGAILNTFKQFAWPAAAPVILNLGIIAAAIWGGQYIDPPIVALAWGVTLAGVVQVLFLIPPLIRLGLVPIPKIDLQHQGVRKIGRLMLPTLFGSSIAQVNVLVDTLIASLLVAGSVSWLYMSDRLLEFPLGVFGIALSTVILPSLSRFHAGKDRKAFSDALNWALRLGVLIGMPAALGLGLLAAPILTTLFEYGNFDAFDVSMSAASLQAYALGLPGFILVKILAPAYYARQDAKTPVKIGIFAMVSNMALNVVFVWALLNYPVSPAHAGLALASSCSAYINAGLLWRGLRKADVFDVQKGWLRVLLGQALGLVVLAGLIWLGLSEWQQWSDWRWYDRAWRLVALVCGAGIAYLAVVLTVAVKPKELLKVPG